MTNFRTYGYMQSAIEQAKIDLLPLSKIGTADDGSEDEINPAFRKLLSIQANVTKSRVAQLPGYVLKQDEKEFFLNLQEAPTEQQAVMREVYCH